MAEEEIEDLDLEDDTDELAIEGDVIEDDITAPNNQRRRWITIGTIVTVVVLGVGLFMLRSEPSSSSKSFKKKQKNQKITHVAQTKEIQSKSKKDKLNKWLDLALSGSRVSLI